MLNCDAQQPLTGADYPPQYQRTLGSPQLKFHRDLVLIRRIPSDSRQEQVEVLESSEGGGGQKKGGQAEEEGGQVSQTG
jgi:hypothetical protein